MTLLPIASNTRNVLYSQTSERSFVKQNGRNFSTQQPDLKRSLLDEQLIGGNILANITNRNDLAGLWNFAGYHFIRFYYNTYLTSKKKKDERFPFIYKLRPSSDANSEFALKVTALEHDSRLHISVA